MFSEGESQLNKRILTICKDAPGFERLTDKPTESNMLHMDTNAALYRYLPFVLYNWKGEDEEQEPIFYIALLMSVWINRFKYMDAKTDRDIKETMEMVFTYTIKTSLLIMNRFQY